MLTYGMILEERHFIMHVAHPGKMDPDGLPRPSPVRRPLLLPSQVSLSGGPRRAVTLSLPTHGGPWMGNPAGGPSCYP